MTVEKTVKYLKILLVENQLCTLEKYTSKLMCDDAHVLSASEVSKQHACVRLGDTTSPCVLKILSSIRAI
jgi:hypothetical protein